MDASFRLRLTLCVGLLVWSGTARADTCPAPDGHPGLARIDPQTRMLFLLRALDGNADHLRTWSLAWGTTYAGAMTAQPVAIPLVHGPARIDLTAGAIAAGVGTLSLYLLPLRITSQAGRAHEDALDPDVCRALARVEARFFETADIDRLSGGWIAHAGNVAINGALALVLGVAYGRWVSALISAIVGLSVGEANLLTQPHELVSAQKRYLSLGTSAIGPTDSTRSFALPLPALARGDFAVRW